MSIKFAYRVLPMVAATRRVSVGVTRICTERSYSVNVELEQKERRVVHRILNEADHKEVWDVILNKYVPAEFLFKFAEKMSKEDVESFFGDSIQKSLAHGASLGGFDTETGRLVSLGLTRLGKLENDECAAEKDQPLLSLAVRQQKAILKYLLGKDISETFKTKNFMRGFLLFTDPDYAGQGVAKDLIRRGYDIAREEGCEVVIMLALNPYTKKILEKYGFVKEKSIVCKDYVDPLTGKKILERFQAPYDEISRLVLRFPRSQ